MRMVDIAVVLEAVADALPDRQFTSDGDEVPADKPNPGKTEPPPPKPPSAASDFR